MPRNGSGAYNLPAGNPVAPNTTIQSSWANTTLQDLAAAITASIAKDGQTTPTNNLPMGSFKHTGVANANARNQYAAVGQVQDFGFNWCGTAGGTADVLTLSPTVGISAYAAGQTFWFIPSAANTGAVTVNVSGVGAKAITKSGTTALSAGDLATSRIYSIVYDGTRFQLMSDPLGTYAPLASPAFTGTPTAPTAAQGTNTTQIATTAFVQQELAAEFYHVPVRQTVLSGPTGSNGEADFGGSTGSTGVIATGSLIVTAAGGHDSEGAIDRVGSITNPQWSNLTTNGTMYLYLDVGSTGTCSTGSTTLEPVYQQGGTYSTASGQFTFNIQEMTAKVGDGSAANQAYRVFMGEVTVAGNVVTAIRWYAIQGRYQSAETAIATDATTSLTHNIGVMPRVCEIVVINKTTDLGYTVGEETYFKTRSAALEDSISSPLIKAKNTAKIRLDGEIYVESQSSTTHGAIDTTKWRIIVRLQRGW